jgi:hypothetical protein
MWTPAGYMKANETEYRVFVTKPEWDCPTLVMATWDKEKAEALNDALTGTLVISKIEEVAL